MLFKNDFFLYSAAIFSCVVMIILLMTSNSISYNLVDSSNLNDEKKYLLSSNIETKKIISHEVEKILEQKNNNTEEIATTNYEKNINETDDSKSEIEQIIIDILLENRKKTITSVKRRDKIIEIYPDTQEERIANNNEEFEYKDETTGHIVVRKGDCLSKIAERLNINVKDLVSWNNLKNPEIIHPGQILVLKNNTEYSKNLSENKKNITQLQYEQEFIWPTINKNINSDYGMRSDPFTGKMDFHPAIDIAGRVGDPVFAVKDGTVIFTGKRNGYGNMIILRHNNEIFSVYAHNSINLVRNGQNIKQGQIIAKIGSTGKSTAPHLHFEIRKNIKPLNPLYFLNNHIAVSPEGELLHNP